MDTQPVYRGAGALRPMKASAPQSVWGNPFALCLPMEGTTWSSPARRVGVAILREMLMKPYQQVNTLAALRDGAH